MKKSVAFFDFDGTLVKGDSLWPFLLAAAGRGRCVRGLCRAAMARIFGRKGVDKRTVFKDVLLEESLKGVSLSVLPEACARLKCWARWIEPSVLAMKDLHAQGVRIVVASGSLDLYLSKMLEELPVDDILCTRMQNANGVLTGRVVDGNCVRQEKAVRVAAYLKEHGPFEESWAYGNAPHDLPMMRLVDHGVVIPS